MIRLNKYLSECGLASRRKVETLILEGRVSVNDQTVTQLYTKIDPDNDVIKLDGDVIERNTKVYFVMNKPKGYVTTTKDEKNRKTVMELMDPKHHVYPVGRLDFNTSGVLFFTNDGDFANFLLHPNNNIPRIYRVNIDKPLTIDHKHKMLNGIYIDEKKGKFEKILFPSHKVFKVLNVITTEGRNHFVKNMFKALGYKVVSLSRIKYAGITVTDIPPGGYKQLSEAEIKNIIRKYGQQE